MSALSLSERIAVDELIARYCHLVDHNDGEGWASLFTPEGSFEVVGIMRMQGTEQLRAVPGNVAAQGGARWRHQITNIATEAGPRPDTARVQAYCLVTDWRESGKLFAFSDYDMHLCRPNGAWLIKSATATSVS
jgi:hypothetical protein